MQTKLLTIVIPTYDRPIQLKRCLEALVPQLNESCQLYIFDNHSPTPVTEVAEPILNNQPFSSWTITRHPFNIGGPANIMHSFQYADTPWVWVLGDDDTPKPNAIKTILELIAAHSDSLAFVFRVPEFGLDLCEKAEPNVEVLTNLKSFLESDAFYCGGLISAAVYHAPSFQKHFSMGIEFGSCYYPHLAVLIRSQLDFPERHVVYIQEPLVNYIGDGMIPVRLRRLLPNVRNLSRLLPFDPERQAILGSKLVSRFTGSCWHRLFYPSFLTLAAASAYRHTTEGDNVVRRMRRLCAESIEWDQPRFVFPWIGFLMTLRFGLALFIGRCLKIPIKMAYRIKAKNSRSYPNSFDAFSWEIVP